MKNRKSIRYAALAALCAVLVAGCSSGMDNNDRASVAPAPGASGGSSGNYNYGEEAKYDSINRAPTTDGMMSKTDESSEEREKKIIKTGNIGMQTDRFDDAVSDVSRATDELGGYIESANLYYENYSATYSNRVWEATLRVPSESFDELMRRVEEQGRVQSSSQSAEDRTSEYFDMQARLETRRIEEERVLELIRLAYDVDDLISLEERLSSIRTDIELYERRMTNIDRLAAFSTIHLTLREASRETLLLPVSDDLGSRIQRAFMTSVNGTTTFFQGFALFIVSASVPLALLCIPAAVVFLVIRKRRAVKAKA
jgi:hypothetical protein